MVHKPSSGSSKGEAGVVRGGDVSGGFVVSFGGGGTASPVAGPSTCTLPPVASALGFVRGTAVVAVAVGVAKGGGADDAEAGAAALAASTTGFCTGAASVAVVIDGSEVAEGVVGVDGACR
jgi:hypothetical protein